jgi:hypothetical protein
MKNCDDALDVDSISESTPDPRAQPEQYECHARDQHLTADGKRVIDVAKGDLRTALGASRTKCECGMTVL